MGIDSLFMEFVHGLCVTFGDILTPLLRIVSIMGEKSWVFLLISFVLCLNKKTRWIGATAILAIFISWVVADIGIKPMVMRMRPYTANNIYQDYWRAAGSYPESDYSMPSGHVLGCAAFFISLYITSKKDVRGKISTIGVIVVMLMALSRMYFMHHYFTDCVVGAMLAVVMSFIAKVIIKLIYKLFKANEDIGFCRFVINFDLFAKK